MSCWKKNLEKGSITLLQIEHIVNEQSEGLGRNY